MDPTALATFLAVAQHGSVTAAALALHTVQSNVTARLHQLESELGARLFERHSRGVTLTSAGTRLLAYAERLRALSVEAKAAVRDDGLAHGKLRIGSMESTAFVRLPSLLGAFHGQHPEVQIEVRTGPTAELLEHVLSHRLDGAFIAGPLNHPRLEGRTVYREELVLVCARDGVGMGQRLARGELTAITFREGCSYRQRLETLFTARGWLPFRRLEFGSVEGMLACVAQDVGVALLPRSVVEARASDALRIESLTPEPLWVDTLFVRRVDAYLGNTLQAFDRALEGAAPHTTAATPSVAIG